MGWQRYLQITCMSIRGCMGTVPNRENCCTSDSPLNLINLKMKGAMWPPSFWHILTPIYPCKCQLWCVPTTQILAPTLTPRNAASGLVGWWIATWFNPLWDLAKKSFPLPLLSSSSQQIDLKMMSLCWEEGDSKDVYTGWESRTQCITMPCPLADEVAKKIVQKYSYWCYCRLFQPEKAPNQAIVYVFFVPRHEAKWLPIMAPEIFGQWLDVAAKISNRCSQSLRLVRWNSNFSRCFNDTLWHGRSIAPCKPRHKQRPRAGWWSAPCLTIKMRGQKGDARERCCHRQAGKVGQGTLILLR